MVNRADGQLGNEVTGVGYGDGGGVKMSDNCNTGVVRLLYQYYAHIPWKHNSIYNSVHIKHGG